MGAGRGAAAAFAFPSGNPLFTKKLRLDTLRSSFWSYMFSIFGNPVAMTVTSTSSLMLLSMQAPKMMFAE